MRPVIIINAKTYPQSTGSAVFPLVELCDRVMRETGVQIGLAVAEHDLLAARNEAKNVDIYAQHVDAGAPGRNTGYVLARSVATLGVGHTLLNHSEHKLPWQVLEETVEECHAAGLRVIICADTLDEASKVARLQPAFVAVEPPELIGGEVSVSTAHPSLITAACEAVGTVPLLVGAGIKNGRDVRLALELGAAGVLVASGVVLAQNPEAALRDLCT